MTKNEALRLAVDALSDADYELGDEAIAWIKVALEMNHEPVACKECHLKDTVYDLLGDLKVANLKLSVRSKRKWVGLTDEEIEDFVSALWPVGAGAGKLLRAVEAKLKEKNT